MISFVIAAYNEEKNIVRCLEQLLRTNENFEVIIVDDGSKDGTLQIARVISEHDSRVKVVCQENSGVSVARNTGFEQVTGDWVAFVDADDIICPTYVTAFENATNTKKYDILQAYQYKENPYLENDISIEIDAQYMQLVALNRKKYIEQNEDSVEGILESVHGAYGKLFSVSFLRKNHIRFKENMGLGEDLLFYVETLEKTEKVLFVRRNVYQIVENEHSSTHRFNEKMIDYAILFNHSILDFFEKNGKNEMFYAEMCAQIYNHIEVGITQTILKSGRYPLWKEITSYYACIYDDQDIYRAIRYICNKSKPTWNSLKKWKSWCLLWLLANKKTHIYFMLRYIRNKY